MFKILSLLKNLFRYAEMLDAKSIARRMFVTNSFDGLMSSIGIVLGSYLIGQRDPIAYIAAVIGASVSMGVFSGMVATYFSERAERIRELKKIEKALLHDLRGSVYEKAVKMVPIYVAFWSGIGIVLLPVIGAAPFIFSLLFNLRIDIGILVYSSVAVMIGEMFGLGYYLGKIAHENPLLNGLKLAGIGTAAAIALSLAQLAF